MSKRKTNKVSFGMFTVNFIKLNTLNFDSPISKVEI